MKIKAVGLLSGGLDSTLAAKLMLDQDIDVHAIYFVLPFFPCTPKISNFIDVETAVRQLGYIPIKKVVLGDEYLEIIRKPKFGYGKGMNPCIDCRIIIIKKAAQYMKEISASFLFTGEVLGQRPMSQHRRALETIDKESGVGELILRPLSAGILNPTISETKRWVDRNKLLAIKGRSRKEQMKLALDKGIKDYPSPAGGCLLTDKIFSERLRDYFHFTKKTSIKEISLLKIGRHFRMKNSEKIIVARNESECKLMAKICRREDQMFVPKNFSGPTVILQGKDRKAAIAKMLEYTHSQLPEKVLISCINRGQTINLTRNGWE